ncbi:hypothetical protein KUA55_07610 [Enterococcus sp. ALS3]|uniref:Uncharacterized protein n=1 Tax=Enterococcus alishanensis TaxID=1303817 RepID=A0ABS6TC89_9ENTE|nr:hypothetical protein [Enterococcus alishanensis]MBV7390541.1 hypothetical protein [Enterococcus alishanensis]
MWDKFDRANKPTMDLVTNFVQNPLWNELNEQLESFTPYLQDLNNTTKEGMGQK